MPPGMYMYGYMPVPGQYPGGVPMSVPAGVPGSMPMGVPPGMPPGVPHGVPHGVPPVVQQGLAPQIPQGVPQRAAVPASDLKTSTIYVGNLAPVTTNEELKTLFSQFAPVVHVNVGGPEGGTHKYGFVDLATAVEQSEVLALNGQILNGRPMKVGHAKGTGAAGGGGVRVNTIVPQVAADGPKGFSVYVGNLDNATTTEGLKEFFSKVCCSFWKFQPKKGPLLSVELKGYEAKFWSFRNVILCLVLN